MIRWPWCHTEPPRMAEAQQSLAETTENLELAKHLRRAAEDQAVKLRAIRRRNGLAEAVRADWRQQR